MSDKKGFDIGEWEVCWASSREAFITSEKISTRFNSKQEPLLVERTEINTTLQMCSVVTYRNVPISFMLIKHGAEVCVAYADVERWYGVAFVIRNFINPPYMGGVYSVWIDSFHGGIEIKRFIKASVILKRGGNSCLIKKRISAMLKEAIAIAPTTTDYPMYVNPPTLPVLIGEKQ